MLGIWELLSQRVTWFYTWDGPINSRPVNFKKMVNYLAAGGYHGVSAQTKIAGEGYIAEGLYVWRADRFPEGERPEIGTPTLFNGELLRSDPYDPERKFSDDSDL